MYQAAWRARSSGASLTLSVACGPLWRSVATRASRAVFELIRYGLSSSMAKPEARRRPGPPRHHPRSRTRSGRGGSSGDPPSPSASRKTFSSIASNCSMSSSCNWSANRWLDIRQVSPETVRAGTRRPTTRGTSRGLRGAARLRAWLPVRPGEEEYLVHITTGTHVAQICLFLLTESRYFPARLLQTRRRAGSGVRRRTSRSSTSTCRSTTASPRASARGARRARALKSGIETRNAGFNRSSSRSIASPSPHAIRSF